MDCPNGHGPMSRVGRFLVCGECGHRAADAPRDPEGLDRLPSVIAFPPSAHAPEPHPVLRLHRLCDAAELVTRFATLVVLGELRTQLGDAPLPPDVLTELQSRIERPTFG